MLRLRELLDVWFELVHVPDAFWIALLTVLFVRIVSGVLWHEGQARRERWNAMKAGLTDSLKLAMVLYAVTVGANSLPITAWTLAPAWGWAIYRTIKSIVVNAFGVDSDVYRWFSDLRSAIQDRNRVSPVERITEHGENDDPRVSS